MTTLQEISIDINGANRYVTVSAKAEDDAGRVVLINLLDNGALYALPADAEARSGHDPTKRYKSIDHRPSDRRQGPADDEEQHAHFETSQVEILLSTTDGKSHYNGKIRC
ncbi:MAG: hypothetical protein ACLTKQ_08555 [Acutalibacteraceae bacterium]